MALLYGELQGSLKDNRAYMAAVRTEPEHPASTGLIDTARRFSMACCILPRPVCSTIRRPKASFTSLSLISHLSPTARSHPTCSAVPPLMRPVPLHLPPRPVLRYKRQSARKGNILQPDRQIDRQTDRQDKGMASEETEFVLVESWTPGACKINLSEPPLANCTSGVFRPASTVRLVILESCASGPSGMDSPCSDWSFWLVGFGLEGITQGRAGITPIQSPSSYAAVPCWYRAVYGSRGLVRRNGGCWVLMGHGSLYCITVVF